MAVLSESQTLCNLIYINSMLQQQFLLEQYSNIGDSFDFHRQLI